MIFWCHLPPETHPKRRSLESTLEKELQWMTRSDLSIAFKVSGTFNQPESP